MSKYEKLKKLAEQVNPYNPNGSELIDEERTSINQEFFYLCIELVPVLIKCFEDYCLVNGNTVEEVVEGFGGWGE